MEKGIVFRALLWSFVAFFAWMFVSNAIWPAPVRPPEADTTQPADAVDGSRPQTGPGTTTQPSMADRRSAPPAQVPSSSSAYRVQGAEVAETVTVGSVEGNGQSPWRMEVELSARGASARAATLPDFALHVAAHDRYRLFAPVEAEGRPEFTSLAVDQITLDGREISLRDVIWRRVEFPDAPADAQGVRFEVVVTDDGDRPVLLLVRDFVLQRQAKEDKRYDLYASLSVRNLDEAPHSLVVTLGGPVGVPQEDPRMDNRAVSAGYGKPGNIATDKADFRSMAGNGDDTVFESGEYPLLWAATDNKFFTCTLAPVSSPDDSAVDEYVAAVKAVDLDGAELTTDDVTCELITTERRLAAGETATFGLACYLGPKDRSIFLDQEKNPDYVSRGYYEQIARTYTWCTFGWLAEFMIRLLDGLYAVIRNYGIAIIILVLIVRTLLHPITKKGQVNMMKMQKRMGKLAPKMEEIKKKFANDKARQQQETMKLYRDEGINPAGQMFTCLPMMIQMPIWVALWTSLNNNIAMRHEPFYLWIKDLTAPDALISFGGSYHLPLLGTMIGPIVALNILPILLGVTMYIQQKLMPKPKPPPGQSSTQADQAAMMQKMMPVMSVFFSLILYNAPSGLTLYIMASTLFGTLEQIQIRRHIKHMEANEGLEGAAAKAGRRPSGPRGPLWLRRLRQQVGNQWHQLQKQAEEAQKLTKKK